MEEAENDEDEEFMDSVLAAKFEQDAMNHKRKHGFWPPWHIEMYRAEPMPTLLDHLRGKLANSGRRLARLRQLNAPKIVVAGELALQAQYLFYMACCGPQQEHYRRCIKQAWKRAVQALEMGWQYQDPPDGYEDAGNDA